MTERIKDFVLNPDELDQLQDAIKEGDYYGMQTFDQHLLRALRRRRRLAAGRAERGDQHPRLPRLAAGGWPGHVTRRPRPRSCCWQWCCRCLTPACTVSVAPSALEGGARTRRPEALATPALPGGGPG